MNIETTGMASGGILALVSRGVNGIVQRGRAWQVCTIVLGGAFLLRKKVEVDIP